MLLRMYVRWAEQHGLTVETANYEPGEVADRDQECDSADQKCTMPLATRSERGPPAGPIHHLILLAGATPHLRRSIMPELDDSVEVDINPADLR